MSNEDRHVAALVFTDAMPAEVDLVLETLETSDFIRVDREGPHFADVIIEEGGTQ